MTFIDGNISLPITHTANKTVLIEVIYLALGLQFDCVFMRVETMFA